MNVYGIMYLSVVFQSTRWMHVQHTALLHYWSIYYCIHVFQSLSHWMTLLDVASSGIPCMLFWFSPIKSLVTLFMFNCHFLLTFCSHWKHYSLVFHSFTSKNQDTKWGTKQWSCILFPLSQWARPQQAGLQVLGSIHLLILTMVENAPNRNMTCYLALANKPVGLLTKRCYVYCPESSIFCSLHSCVCFNVIKLNIYEWRCTAGSS